MSYMNHLEKKLRYSNAFSSLNALRNAISFGGNPGLEDLDRHILLDAVEIATETSEESFKKALMYGFHNTGNSAKTSALELAKAINEGLKMQLLKAGDITMMLSILNSETLSDEPWKSLIPKIDGLMVLLNKAKQEDTPNSNLSLVKSLRHLG